jgi:hypothetical protein
MEKRTEMNLATAILVLACSGPKPSPTLAIMARHQIVRVPSGLDSALTDVALRTSGTEEAGTPPPCIGSTCQPRVSIPVPGFEPRIDVKGKGGEFLASTLERMDAGIAATVARAVATSGARLEFRPQRAEDYVPGRPRFGQVALMVRWRLDAWGVPVFQVAASP